MVRPGEEVKTHPGTVRIQLTRLLLCNGNISNVRTNCVRLAIPRTAILDPVRTPPVVITAVPPTPARKPAVPVIPIVVKAAPRPAPITGASRPAERPMTRPPPVDAGKPNLQRNNVIHTKSCKPQHHVASFFHGLLLTINDFHLFQLLHVFLYLEGFGHTTLKFDDVKPT